MKELVVLRHAESGQGHGVLDRDRPLTKRGEAVATGIGDRLRREGVAPGIALSSTALRAMTTARRVAEVCGCEVVPVEELYLAAPHVCLEVLATRGDPSCTVLLVGHNPGLEELIELLGGTRVALPPAGLIRVTLDVENWIEILTAPRRDCPDLP